MMQMKDNAVYQHYRQFLVDHGITWIEPASLINDVDPHAFNYSLEEPLLREFGTYFPVFADYSFGTAQACIRGGDVSRLKRGESNNHLCLFHILPVTYKVTTSLETVDAWHRESIRLLCEFLFERVGLDPDRLMVTYFGGGNLATISTGQVPLSQHFPEDANTREFFLASGIKAHQLIPQSSLDNFVASFEGSGDFYAGPRFEIFYPLGDGSILEIGTGEALYHRQVRRDGQLIDIKASNCAIIPLAVGLERVVACAEQRIRVDEGSWSRPATKFLEDKQLSESSTRASAWYDAFRCVIAVHIAEAATSLSARQKGQLRSLMAWLAQNQFLIQITNDDYSYLTKLAADSLVATSSQQSMAVALERFSDRLEKRKNYTSRKPHDSDQYNNRRVSA
jgi:hypothetical protein